MSLKKKCSHCKKKLLSEYKCRCTNEYCVKCRMPEVHNCSYDYVKAHQDELRKANPIILAEKVDRI